MATSRGVAKRLINDVARASGTKVFSNASTLLPSCRASSSTKRETPRDLVGPGTVPNKWFVEYGKGVDLAIHEAFQTAQQLVDFYNQPPQLAWRACCEFHTSPESFGKIMSTIQPRHAVAFHFFNDEGTRYGMYDGIRATYAGPLSLATDMMVWNVTDEQVVVREAIVTDDVAPTGTSLAYRQAEREPPSVADGWISDFINSGKWDGYTPPAVPE